MEPIARHVRKWGVFHVCHRPEAPRSRPDTNLLITTDRRAYYLRLLSKPDDYVARVAFAYPDDEDNQRKWQQQLAEQKDRQIKSTRIAELPPNAVDSMYFNYRLRGDDGIRPVRVFDDGKKTYIQISQAAKNRGTGARGDRFGR